VIVKRYAPSEVGDLLTRMSEPGHSDRESEVLLLTFCLNCPDPVGALTAVLDAPRSATDEDIAKHALSMPVRPIVGVPASELPSDHPLRNWRVET